LANHSSHCTILNVVTYKTVVQIQRQIFFLSKFWAGAQRTKSLVTSQHNYKQLKAISLARTGLLQVLTLSDLKVICMTFNITNPNPNPNYGTWYIRQILDSRKIMPRCFKTFLKVL
jgi:hypothetical protein